VKRKTYANDSEADSGCREDTRDEDLPTRQLHSFISNLIDIDRTSQFQNTTGPLKPEVTN